MHKAIIYLTNLTHINDGIPATESIPLNIGYLAAHTKKVFGNEVDIKLFNTHLDLVEAVERRKPHILAGSNYLWNSNLSYHYLSHFKKRHPEMITVMGGPTISYNPLRRKEFLDKRRSLDFYITGEGEAAFANLVQVCIDGGMDIDKIKKRNISGCYFLSEGEIISGTMPDRIRCLDTIPSPYLGGYLDKFLEGGFTPILQTNRGCPFSCAYCCSAVDYYNKVTFFSTERVKEEIEYVAKRAKSPSVHIHDDNFGMFEQDYEICRKFKEAQESYGWPVYISAATGKNSKGRIVRCVELLGPSIIFSASLQTTNKVALKNIGRENISLDDLMSIQERLRQIGTNSTSELILPLPGETLKSHLEAIKTLMSSGVDSIGPYTTMLLPASPLYEEERFCKFGMIEKYRVIPRDFGRYEETNALEVEKVCVGTKDLSLEDYILLRGFHFIIYCYYNGETFKELFYYLRGIGCEIYDLCYQLLERIDSAPQMVRKVYYQFLSDTKNELWDSEDDIYRHYREDSNFHKLLMQEEGCNLLQKCHALFFSSYFEIFLDYIFIEARMLLNENGISYDSEIMESIRSYIMNTRKRVLDLVKEETLLELAYDVHAWKEERYRRPLSGYKRKARFKLFQTEKQRAIIQNYIKIYGNTKAGKGKILTRINPKILFREVAVMK